MNTKTISILALLVLCIAMLGCTQTTQNNDNAKQAIDKEINDTTISQNQDVNIGTPVDTAPNSVADDSGAGTINENDGNIGEVI